MSDTELQIGDVVELKSGSPKMTVTGDSLGGKLTCHWFDGSESHMDAFPAAALKIVNIEQEG